MKNIKKLFITGLLTILPIMITINILSWIFKLLNRYLSNNIFVKEMVNYLLKHRVYSRLTSQIVVYILVITIIFVVIIITGLAMKNVMGKKVAQKVDELFSKTPLIKPIYTTMLQIRHLIFSSNDKSYQKVVLIEYPRKNVYSVAFLTNRKNELFKKYLPNEKLVNIFLPTSPNPTSGMFLMLPKEDVIELDMKIEDAIKLIISGGAIIPSKNEIKGEDRDNVD